MRKRMRKRAEASSLNALKRPPSSYGGQGRCDTPTESGVKAKCRIRSVFILSRFSCSPEKTCKSPRVNDITTRKAHYEKTNGEEK